MNWNALHSAGHPLWALARQIAMMGALTAILYLNAAEFDETELRTILWAFIFGGSAEGGVALVSKFVGKKEAADT